MTHLTEDTTVGGGDTFDCKDGAVGVELGVPSGLTGKINVLGSNLTVFSQLADQFLACKETSFAVGAV